MCEATQVSDLSPLKGMPLKDLGCDFKPERDAEILRSIKTLERSTANRRRSSGRISMRQRPPRSLGQEVAALPAEKQVEAVMAKLKERNPGFDGKVTHVVERTAW